MKNQVIWNNNEKRLRSGWRILIQIIIISLPILILAAAGIYSSGRLFVFKITATVLPITSVSILFLGRFIDRRKFSDYGMRLKSKGWWLDYGAGVLAGILSASSVTVVLIFLGLAEIERSGQFSADPGRFATLFLLSLIAYIGVGIFEEIIRSYQIRNVLEGLSGTTLGLNGAVIAALLLSGLWSVVMHIASQDGLFLIYILVTGVIYGLFFIWTKSVALAMAMHFAWDFTNSCIFQLGSNVEASIFVVHIEHVESLGNYLLPWVGMIAKALGLLIVILWILNREGKIQIRPELATPTLISGVNRRSQSGAQVNISSIETTG